MKKVFVIFLALIIGLSMSAQIQTKFFGFKLGTSTKSEVHNKYKNEKNFLEEDGVIYVGDLKFAGHEWGVTAFGFYNNKLMYVAFTDQEPSTTFQLMELTWKDIKNRLSDKYSDYYIDTTSSRIYYSDGSTNLTFGLSDETGTMMLMLYYSNIALKEKERQAEEDEL